jgi:deazaflavin-dependent oxidoreductase (nitroreductase family)
MSDDPNSGVIEEFRANGGVVDEAMGGYFKGKPMLLAHVTGARSGKERTVPPLYLDEGGRLYVFATRGGAPKHPGWYYGLKANPDVTVELGSETFPARAVEVTGDERDRLYAEQARRLPQFADYEEKTTRVFPGFELQRT